MVSRRGHRHRQVVMEPLPCLEFTGLQILEWCHVKILRDLHVNLLKRGTSPTLLTFLNARFNGPAAVRHIGLSLKTIFLGQGGVVGSHIEVLLRFAPRSSPLLRAKSAVHL